VKQIQDDRFLVDQLRTEPSAAVRAAMIETLRKEESLREIVRTAYHWDDRELALQRLKKGFNDSSSDVAAAHEALERRVEALAAETDSGQLLERFNLLYLRSNDKKSPVYRLG
jgi:hypothetical protein